MRYLSTRPAVGDDVKVGSRVGTVALDDKTNRPFLVHFPHSAPNKQWLTLNQISLEKSSERYKRPEASNPLSELCVNFYFFKELMARMSDGRVSSLPQYKNMCTEYLNKRKKWTFEFLRFERTDVGAAKATPMRYKFVMEVKRGDFNEKVRGLEVELFYSKCFDLMVAKDGHATGKVQRHVHTTESFTTRKNLQFPAKCLDIHLGPMEVVTPPGSSGRGPALARYLTGLCATIDDPLSDQDFQLLLGLANPPVRGRQYFCGLQLGERVTVRTLYV